LAFRVLPCGHLAIHERTKARSAGIRNLEAMLGNWVSRLHHEIFLTGFEAGEEFVVRKGSTGYIETFLAPDSHGNFMPPSATQQLTIRDRLLQLPLPESALRLRSIDAAVVTSWATRSG
jgi:hypothetical protein